MASGKNGKVRTRWPLSLNQALAIAGASVGTPSSPTPPIGTARSATAGAVSVSILPAPAVADRTVPIGGVGELGVPTLAPALANAWFRLSGQRVRTLPFFPNATMGDG